MRRAAFRHLSRLPRQRRARGRFDRRSARRAASPAALRSSASADRNIRTVKSPGNSTVSGTFLLTGDGGCGILHVEMICASRSERIKTDDSEIYRQITEYRRRACWRGVPLGFCAPFLSNFRIVGTAGRSHRRELLRCGIFIPFFGNRLISKLR